MPLIHYIFFMNELNPDEQIDQLPESPYRIIQHKKMFRYGSDALLLADFCTRPAKRIHHRDYVVDLCSGNGIIPLLLASRVSGRFCSMELQKEASDLAVRSVSLNGLEDRIQVLNGDIRDIKNLLPQNCASVVTVNPPYMKCSDSGISENQNHALNLARHEISCTLSDVVAAASWLLKSSGTLFMIHRPDRLSEIFTALHDFRLEPKRLKLVHPDITKAATMVLIESRKDASPGLITDPPVIMY